MLSKKSPFLSVIALDCTWGFWLSRSLDQSLDSHARDANWGRNGWPDGTERQGLKVLYDSGEMEFVTRAGQPSMPHAFKSVVDLEVSKTHLDALTFIP